MTGFSSTTSLSYGNVVLTIASGIEIIHSLSYPYNLIVCTGFLESCCIPFVLTTHTYRIIIKIIVEYLSYMHMFLHVVRTNAIVCSHCSHSACCKFRTYSRAVSRRYRVRQPECKINAVSRTCSLIVLL
jgi:hypothetical protein